MQQWTHIPVLAGPVADFLLIRSDGVYVDGTLGLGGHTKFLLSRLGPQARIFGFDKDEEALEMARRNVNDARLTAVHASYVQAPQVLRSYGIDGADGALFDLGLSSYQLDNPARGFSLLRDGPLDMRFDLSASLTAEEIVNTWPLAQLERILQDYGEERNAHAIAMALMAVRRNGKIETTFQLKKIVENTVRGRGKIHPATQTFQALRIAVNDELACVQEVLRVLPDLIKSGGRAGIITFHSLEDRLVKNAFKHLSSSGAWRLVNKHVVAAGYEEARQNPRSRSAKLRVIERL